MVEQKSDLQSEGFQQLLAACRDEKGRGQLLLAGTFISPDIHIPRCEYYIANSSSGKLIKVLELVKLLSEDTLYNYSLGAGGGFIKSCLKYFEKSIEKTAVVPNYMASDPDSVAPVEEGGHNAAGAVLSILCQG